MQPFATLSETETIQLCEMMLRIDRDLTEARLVSFTDQTALDHVFSRVLRKMSKDHPELKLAAKWTLRSTPFAQI
ncbi:MAG: hypothetical protein C4535_10905 [Comamonadaceae bacterium]|nr:MAG: hypothetical protein C4535_10905 [Comamonadaceae bacterium]